MRKLFTLFSAMLVALAVNATPTDFSSPYYCAADDAELSGTSTTTEATTTTISGKLCLVTADPNPNYLAWIDVAYGKAVASWTVTTTKGCYVSVSLDLGSAGNNKHIFQVKILEGSTVRGTVAEGDSDPSGGTDGYNQDYDKVKPLDGTILLPAAGIYTVELRNERGYGKGAVKNVILTYAADAPSEVIEVSSVALDKTELALQVEEVEQLTATVLPDNAFDPTVTWSSTDESVATVDGGFITALKAGTATIKAKAGEKEATCAVTVAAAAVPEVELTSTYTLEAKIAHIEGKIGKKYEGEKYKIYGKGNKVCGKAFWTVRITNPCILSASLANANGDGAGSLFELDVFKGEDSITTVIQPAKSLWWSGNIDMDGTITLVEAGEYTFRLRNTQEYSVGKVSGIMLSYEGAPRTLYCKMEHEWWTKDGAKIACYAKVDGGVEMATWPGTIMTDLGNDLWKIVISAKYNKINFTRVGSDGSYWGAKTAELSVPVNSNLYTIAADEKWDPNEAKGSWSVKDAKYYIAGNLTDWDNDKIGALADEQVLSLAAGKYQMKVVGKDWYGMNKLTSVAKGLYPDQDGNICFTLAEAGDVTINFVEGETITTFTLAGAFALPSVKLIGAGTEFGNWVEENAIAFTNDEGDLSASHTFTLAAGDYEFKMIREWEWLTKEGGTQEAPATYDLHREWTTVKDLYRDSEGKKALKITADINGNYKFTWTYATGELVITFPANDPSALDNTAVEGKATKSIENGQLFIIKNGVRYNVLGTRVR